MTIIITQKEFDLLEQVVKHEPTEKKPYKVVSNNNGAVANLVHFGLVQARPKEGNALMQELAYTTLGQQVVANEVAHEIVSGAEQISQKDNETKEDNQMEQQEMNIEETRTGVEVRGGYVLENDVPMPEIMTGRAPRKTSYPLELMEVGQSFFIPIRENEDPQQGLRRVRSAVTQGRKRKFGENGTAQFYTAIVEGGYRVWRKA